MEEENILQGDDMITTPRWMGGEEMEGWTVGAIQYGGCASGAYMPAVTYHTALETMNEYGSEIIEYLEDVYGEIPQPPKGETWSGLAVFYFSLAVETWAAGIEVAEGVR